MSLLVVLRASCSNLAPAPVPEPFTAFVAERVGNQQRESARKYRVVDALMYEVDER